MPGCGALGKAPVGGGSQTRHRNALPSRSDVPSPQNWVFGACRGEKQALCKKTNVKQKIRVVTPHLTPASAKPCGAQWGDRRL